MKLMDKIDNHDAYLKQIHLFLNQMYHTLLYCDDEALLSTEAAMKKFKHIETSWMNIEKNDCLSKYDFNKEVKDVSVVEAALKKHPVYDHALFHYFSLEANKSEIQAFISSESILNLEFFDYLSLSIIGTADHIKSEIMLNLWDEAGRGNIQHFHTTLFSRLMQGLNLSYKRDLIAANMCWEGLAGINLFSYLALYSFNKSQYFGLLAATEMLDPPHYQKLLQGLKRLFLPTEIDISYYVEHETIDRQHGYAWLEKIIIPELKKYPHKTPSFWLGFYLRLDSVQRYYDSLLQTFLRKNAA